MERSVVARELRIILGTIKPYTVKDLEFVRECLCLSNTDMSVLLDISESSYYRLKRNPAERLTIAHSLIVDHLKVHFIDLE